MGKRARLSVRARALLTAALASAALWQMPAGAATAPVIMTPTDNAIVTARFTVTGTADPGANVDVLDVTDATAALQGSAVTTANGSWSVVAFYQTSGQRKLQAVTTDEFGNVLASPILTVAVDANAPTLVIELPANNSIYLPGDTVSIEGTASDVGLGVLAVEVHLFSMGEGVETRQLKGSQLTCISGCPVNRKVEWTYSPSVGTGYFTAKIWAIDVAGNRSPQPAEVNFLKVA